MTMSKPDPYHQKECVHLCALDPQSRRDLHRHLKVLGFKSEDDFYYVPRKGKIAPWQAINLLDISVGLGGRDTYVTEEDVADGTEANWDQLTCDYLMAFLPRECIQDAVRLIFQITDCFALSAKYQDVLVGAVELQQRWNEIADQLAAEYDEPGSEGLAVFVELAR